MKKILLKINSSEIYLDIQVLKIHAVTFTKISDNINNLKKPYSEEDVLFIIFVTLVSNYLKKCFKKYLTFIISRLLHNQKTIKLILTIYNHTTLTLTTHLQL